MRLASSDLITPAGFFSGLAAAFSALDFATLVLAIGLAATLLTLAGLAFTGADLTLCTTLLLLAALGDLCATTERLLVFTTDLALALEALFTTLLDLEDFNAFFGLAMSDVPLKVRQITGTKIAC